MWVISRKLLRMDLRTQLGSLAEAKVIAKLIEHGFHVFVQFSGKGPFDLVVYKDERLLRVQVKGTSCRTLHGAFPVLIKSVRSYRTGNVVHKFDPSQCDVLAVYVAPLDKVAFLQADEIVSRGQLNLRESLRQEQRKCWVIRELEDPSRLLRDHTRDTCDGDDMVQTTTQCGS